MRAEYSQKSMKKSEHEIARLKIRIDEKERYIEKLKRDFERVFEELKKVKREYEKKSTNTFYTENAA